MYEITEKTLKDSYKPYDIVTDKSGNVGFIQEVNINECQPEPCQISYSVEWLIGNSHNAWYSRSELEKHCNIFVKIAECSCHPFGNNKKEVKKLMSSGI